MRRFRVGTLSSILFVPPLVGCVAATLVWTTAAVLAADNSPSLNAANAPTLTGPSLGIAAPTESTDAVADEAADQTDSPAKGSDAARSETKPGAGDRPDGKPASPVESGEDAGEPVGDSSAADAHQEASKADTAASPADATATDEKDESTEGQAKEGDVVSMEALGEPLAPGMMTLLNREMLDGIRKRGVSDAFARFQSYAGGRLNASAGRYTGSELTGNCRLRWYDYLLRHVTEAPALAERFTRELHASLLDPEPALSPLLTIAAPRMDLTPPPARAIGPINTPEEALAEVQRSLVDAQAAFAAAVAPLTKSELRELQNYLYPVLIGQNHVGHTLNDRGTGRRLCDLMEKMDRSQLYVAADALSSLSSPSILNQLAKLQLKDTSPVDGVTGAVERIDTPAGTILIGGREQNAYYLDKLPDVAAVIDLGGNDGYSEGVVNLKRPVLLLIDLQGNDLYRGSQPGIQGAAMVGASVLIDAEGDDNYQAQDMAQGAAMAGVGILIDGSGNDHYIAVRRVQGQSIGGIGLLVDRAGDDDYHAAMWSQGMAGPLGFALLEDVGGNDHFYSGGMWPDSYEETPGLEGWGQGVGAGLRQVGDGGIGVILDGAGDDVYEFDYLSHGGGYWCGLGFARDFGGNDQRLITRKSYSGGPRTEPKFQRFGCGWGCHYSLGFLFDDSGDDVYEGTIMGSGMAWDCSEGVLCDFAGNDRYEATGGLTQGVGAQMGLGILFDYNGDDVHLGYGQGYAPGSISYHDLPDCGGNFSFMVDYGGTDKYGCGARNNSYIQRSAAGGFLIDRPREEEMQAKATADADQGDR